MTAVSDFQQLADRLYSEPSPVLTPEILAAARVVLAEPETVLSGWALEVLRDTVLAVDEHTNPADESGVERSSDLLRQFLRRRDLDTASRGRVLRQLSIAFRNLGQPLQAAAVVQELIGIARDLAEDDPEYKPTLAVSLTELATRLQDGGQSREAIIHATEAVSLWESLAATDPSLRAQLAAELNNLAVSLSDDGRLKEAADQLDAAVTIYRDLLRDEPAKRLELARTLLNRATCLSEFGDRRAALRSAKHKRPLRRYEAYLTTNSTCGEPSPIP